MNSFRRASLCIILLLHLNWNSPSLLPGVGAEGRRRPLPRRRVTPRRSARIQTQEFEDEVQRIRRENQELGLPRYNVSLPKGVYCVVNVLHLFLMLVHSKLDIYLLKIVFIPKFSARDPCSSPSVF